MNALPLPEPAAEDPQERPTPRGWFLAKHNARVIDRGDAFIVEFADRPWYTEACRREAQRNARLCVLLQALHLI